MKSSIYSGKFATAIIILTLASFASVTVNANVKDHKGSNHGSQQFGKAFREGATSANQVGLPLANGAELKTLAAYNETSISGTQGAWQFSINGWEGDAYADKVRVYQAPGVIANYGNRFEYVFYLPNMDTRYVDRVDAKLEKAKKNLNKSGKGVVVTYPRTPAGQLSVHAAFTYDDKTSTGLLKEHIEQLLLNSRALFNDYLVESRNAKGDYMKELRKSSPANLEDDAFYLMLTDFSGFNPAPYVITDAGTQERYAFISWNKRDMLIWNHKNSMVLGAVVYPASNLSEAQLNSLVESWKAWGQKKLGKHTQQVDVRKMKPKQAPVLVLTLQYPLDGTLKGGDIDELYNDFLEKKLPDAQDEYMKLQQKALK